jgi:hypothetical protein
MTETIKTIEQAREVINNLQRRCDKYYQEMLLAKARIYDIQYYGRPEPKIKELKSENISYQAEIKKLVEQRDRLKEKLNGGVQ